MKKIFFTFTLFAFAGLLFARGKKSTTWIEQPYFGYSEDSYICATGSGKSQEEADKKALSAVSAILVQSISAEEVVNQSSSSSGEDLSTYLANIKTNSTLKDISGLSIKDRTKAKDKTFYSRAVLDKSLAVKQYTLALQKNSLAVETLLEESAAYKKSFDSCKTLIQAYSIAAENDYLISVLSVLRPSAKHTLSYGSSADISAKIRSAFHSITVRVQTSGTAGSQIASSAASVINSYGFATTTKENAEYVFSVNLSLEDLEKPAESDIFYTRYILTSSLAETSSQKEVLNYSANKRIGKLSRKDAQQSAVRSAQTVLQEEFSQKFKALFD